MFGCTRDDPIAEPLSREELHKFCYHLAAATRAFRGIEPPEEYLAEFIGLGARLLLTYESALCPLDKPEQDMVG